MVLANEETICKLINRLCNSLSLSSLTEQFLEAIVIGTHCRHSKKTSDYITY